MSYSTEYSPHLTQTPPSPLTPLFTYMRNPRPKKVKGLAQGHSVNENMGFPNSENPLLLLLGKTPIKGE